MGTKVAGTAENYRAAVALYTMAQVACKTAKIDEPTWLKAQLVKNAWPGRVWPTTPLTLDQISTVVKGTICGPIAEQLIKGVSPKVGIHTPSRVAFVASTVSLLTGGVNIVALAKAVELYTTNYKKVNAKSSKEKAPATVAAPV